MVESNNVSSGLPEFNTQIWVVVEALLFVLVNNLVHSLTGTPVKSASTSVPIATTNLLLDSVIEA